MREGGGNLRWREKRGRGRCSEKWGEKRFRGRESINKEKKVNISPSHVHMRERDMDNIQILSHSQRIFLPQQKIDRRERS